MTDDRLERLLAETLEARARSAVGDHSAPPAPRFADPRAQVHDLSVARPHRSNRVRIWAPLAAAAAVVAVVSGALVLSGRDDHGPVPIAGPTTSTSAPAPSASTSSSVPITPAQQVGLKTLTSDGVTYGVGMPVIVYFSKKITDARAFQAGTTVTADGKPLTTAWYFQTSSAGNGPIEAQLRPQKYWPAHSSIHIDFPRPGTPLGGGRVLDTKLTSLDFKIGAKQIAVVDNSTHELTLMVDDLLKGRFPVSLGANDTRTKRGIKVVMEKGRDISMRGPGYYDPHIKDTQRLTFGGEYLHSAPWNTRNIDNGVNSSNGCTNLHPNDAATLYGDMRVGDVVTFPNANGPTMQVGQGYGLWNVSWARYQTGGLVPTR